MLDSLNNDTIFTLTSPSTESMNSNSQLPQKPVMMSIEDGEEIVVVEPTDPDEDRLKQTLVVPSQESSTPVSQSGVLNSSKNGVCSDPVVLNQLIQVLNGRVTTESTSQAPRLLVTSTPSVLSLQTTPTTPATPQQASFMVQPLSPLQATQLLNLSSAQPVASPVPNFMPNASCLRGLISADPMLYGVVVNWSTAAMITQLANHVSTTMLNLAQQCSMEGNANMCLQITEINQFLGVLISLASSMSTSLPGLLSLRGGTTTPQPLVSSVPQTNPVLTSLISSTTQPVSTTPAVSSSSESITNSEAPSNVDSFRSCPIQVKSEPSPPSVSSGKQSPPIAGMLTKHGKVLKSVKTHSRPKRHGCPFSGCTRAFNSRYNLVEHIRIHTGERPFVCPVAGCTSRFKRRRDLFEHSAMHEGKSKVHTLIPTPGKTLLVTSVLPEGEKSKGIAVNGSSRGRHFCPFPNCNSSYARRHCLNQHMCKHTGVGPFYCDHSKCTMRFFNAEDLERHKIIHSFPYHVDEAKNHICMYENCGKMYPKMNKLLEHIRSHTGERPFACKREGCGASFSRQYGLRRHLLTHSSSTNDEKTEHSEVQAFAKPGLITSTPLVARPNTITSSTPVFPQTCGLANQAPPKPQTTILNLFQALTSSPMHPNVMNTTANAETAHEPTNAGPIKPEPDSTVLSVATANQNLTLTSVTSQPKSKLPLVQRSSKAAATPSASALAEKALVVTCAFGKRRHVCPIENCQKVFPKLNKLREHICRHTGERPYACEECTATFVRMYDLRRHAQIHTRKKAGILNSTV
ncbi:hypothetical protein Aperf_G00000109442 [Anoplocephala perfoliata]